MICGAQHGVHGQMSTSAKAEAEKSLHEWWCCRQIVSYCAAKTGGAHVGQGRAGGKQHGAGLQHAGVVPEM